MARYVTPDIILQALQNARGGIVEQGSVGAGTGTICFGFKGGIASNGREVQPISAEKVVKMILHGRR